MTAYENLTESITKLLQLVCDFGTGIGYKINIQKSISIVANQWKIAF